MTLPHSLRDDLLSGYLDDALSSDEKLHVQRLLETDAAARQQLEALQSLRQQLRGEAARGSKLGADFASKVVQAAFVEATRAGLPATHPVRLAASRSVALGAAPRSRFSRRWATWGTMVASIAATILLVVGRGYWSSDVPHSRPVESLLADHAPVSETNIAPNVTLEPVLDNLPSATELVPGVDQRIASSETPDAIATMTPETLLPTENAFASATPAPMPLPRGTPTVPAIDISRDITAADLALAEEMMRDPKTLRFAMLVDVELTDAGRQINVVQRALEEVNITLEREVQVNDQVLQQLAAAKIVEAGVPQPEPLAGASELLVVQGPSLDLDKFLISLMTNPAAVKGAGLQVLFQPPAVQAIESVAAIDANAVRHADGNPIARRVVGEDVQRRWFKGVRAETRFAPINAAGGNFKWTSGQPDVSMAMLILIR